MSSAPHLSTASRLAPKAWRRCAKAVACIALCALGGCGASGSGPNAKAHAPRASVHAGTFVAEAPDPLAAQSYPQPAGAPRHAPATAPRKAAREAFVSPGAPTNQEIRAELRQEKQAEQEVIKSSPRATVDAVTGTASASPGMPLKIQEVIAGGNAIADFPYVYGGGHRSFVDDAYDCSGSVSYALAAAGLINAPETSGQLESWGAPGQGRYLTVFAAAGHTFMWVDGLWFDTAGRAGPYTTRWLTKRPQLAGYVIRHYPGL
jgi:hypothetical protein